MAGTNLIKIPYALISIRILQRLYQLRENRMIIIMVARVVTVIVIKSLIYTYFYISFERGEKGPLHRMLKPPSFI